jgi:hypothetical protein
MNIYTLYFLIDQNKTKKKNLVAEKKLSKTQKKKIRILKRIKLKNLKGGNNAKTISTLSVKK